MNGQRKWEGGYLRLFVFLCRKGRWWTAIRVVVACSIGEPIYIEVDDE